MGYKDGILFMMGFLALLLTVVIVMLCQMDQRIIASDLRMTKVESMVLKLQVDLEANGKQLDRLAAWKEVDEIVEGLSKGK